MVRLFISLDLPKHLVDKLSLTQDTIKKTNLVTASYTKKENIHLTLKFLGEVKEKDIEDVQKALHTVPFSSFKVKITSLGVFSKESIRIIWAKLDSIDLINLHTKIDSVLEHNFKREERFMSHITIARVKSVRDKKSLLIKLENISLDEEGTIDSFSLLSSKLTPGGPEYTILRKYPARA